MKIHNLLEEVVYNTVEEIFQDEESHPVMGFCTCEQCKLDVACYVLNRTEPQYVLSGRGLAHMKTDYNADNQKTADLTALVMEGIKQVSRSKRPFFPHSEETHIESDKGPFFNFPIISGRIFNGKTFEPVSGIEISLFSDGDMVPMKNPNWQNPCLVARSTAGNFMFWPESLSAKKVTDKKTFNFRICSPPSQYEEFSHVFSLELTASTERLDTFCLNDNFQLGDLYVFLQSDSEKIVGEET